MWTKRSGIMLAYPFEEKRLNQWTSPYLVQPKLDGERCRAEIQDESVKLVSSELNEFKMVPHIREDLLRLGYNNVELDGELYRHGLDFSEIHSIAGRTVNLHDEFEALQYHIFDVVNSSPQIDRTDLVEELPQSSIVKTVPTYVAEDFDQVYNLLKSFTADGYEGVIVRELSAPYVRKRSTFMMKWKPKKQDTYQIIAFKEEIDKNGKPKGALGALGFVGADGSVGWVGTGFTREDRERLWASRDVLLGMMVTVEYQHLTAKRGVPRFSVFVELG